MESARRFLKRACGLALVAALVGASFGAVRAGSRQPETRFSRLSEFDGKRVLTAGGKIAYLWDARSGRLLRRFVGHGSGVGAAVLSPDGKLVATGGYAGMMPWNPGPKDLSVRLWDAGTGQQIAQLLGHVRPVNAVQFSPDGKRLLTGDDWGAIRVWDVRKRKQLLLIEDRTIQTMMRSTEFSPDGAAILAIQAGRTVFVWDSVTGKEFFHVEPTRGGTNSAVFSPDGRTVLTASADRYVKIWDAKTGEEVRRFDCRTWWINEARFTAGGSHVVTCGRDKMVRVWDTATGKELKSISNPGAVDNIVLSPGGKYCLAKWEPNNGVEVPFGSSLWDTESGMEVLRMNHQETDGLVGFAPDGRSFFSIGQAWQPSLLRSTETGQIVRKVKVFGEPSPGSMPSFEGKVGGEARAASSGRGARFRPTADYDGQRLMTTNGTAADLWDAQSGHLLAHLAGHADDVGAVALSPDGKLAATAGRGGKIANSEAPNDTSVRLWGIDSGKEAARLTGATRGIETLQFSADGTRIMATDVAGAVRIWDVRSRRGRLIVASSDGSAVLSPDGRTVVVLEDGCGKAVVLDSRTGREVCRIQQKDGTGAFESAVVSADGRQVLTASLNGIAQTWDAKTGKELQRFAGHSGFVFDAYFIAGASRVVTCGEDGTVRLWDAATGKELSRLASRGVVLRVIPSPDEKHCLTLWCDNRDGGLGPTGSSLWDLGTGREIKRMGVWNISPEGLIGFSADSKSFITSMWWTEEHLSETRSAETGAVTRSFNLVR